MTVALAGGAALIGDDLEPIDPAVVVIEGSSLQAVGEASEVTVPPGAEVVDVTGMTLVPGFIDAHVHLAFAEARDVVRRGVTTVRDLGWPEADIAVLARRSTEGDGPTVLYAGPMLTTEGGYPTRAAWAPPGTGLVVDGPEAAASIVAGLAQRGSSVVKVALNEAAGPTIDARTLHAIVDAAHSLGLNVTTHATGLAQLDKALDAGVDELAHMLMGRDRIPGSTLDRMVSVGMVVVPTLACRKGTELKIGIDNLEAFASRGGRVVYGTDLGNGPDPGIDRGEIEAMAAAGMDGLGIIRSATVDAAAWLGLETTGSLRAGADADVIAVGADPLEDPAALVDVRGVWRRGREVVRG